MFDLERFSHYLTYGATDQKTVRELTDAFHGLIVPGTVAAFQQQGTGGFVLSLSATPDSPPYVIDPRFPLFQQSLEDPKKSHEALAQLLGAQELIRTDEPMPSDFPDSLVQRIAQSWVEFNTSYESRQAAKFKKYADRLDESVDESQARGPSAVIAPYLVSQNDDWWRVSKRLMAATRAAAPAGLDVLRVVGCATARELDLRLADIEDRQVIVWVSGLEELEVLPSKLADYGKSIRAATQRGQACFALYGGFFSVMLGAVGLKGACHGIGYGEYRSWPELHQSGPPPSRYYAPRFHRYINQDLAYQLWSRDADLTACDCEICEMGPPLLSYHDLMKHSVLARQAEIDRWSGLELDDARRLLEQERDDLERDLSAAQLPEPLVGPATRVTRHLARWVSALEQLGPG
jgi:hypothetical protein